MQLGQHLCLGTCGKTYKNLASLRVHNHASSIKNKKNEPGQNFCWQLGYSWLEGEE